jgi:hypothetical protein
VDWYSRNSRDASKKLASVQTLKHWAVVLLHSRSVWPSLRPDTGEGEPYDMTDVHDRGRTVVRSLQELRIHPVLEETGFCVFLPELQESARCQDELLPKEPILVTHTGLILSGFGPWRMAVSRHVQTLECLEYNLTDEDALQFMLSFQKRRKGWNPFIRIRLALKLEGALQQRAMTHMQMGGRYKGSARLPEAAQIDVREQIAAIAGVGSRNVSKVKDVLSKGHPRILGELANGSISINRAHWYCGFPFAKQLEGLTEEGCDRVADDLEQGLFRQSKESGVLEVTAVLRSLQQQEIHQPGSVSMELSRRKRSVILVGEDLQSRMRESARVEQP